MKEGFREYINQSVLDLREKKGAEKLLKDWRETLEYVEAEVEKVISKLK